ncbi:hypothetical protein EXU85_20605 [Spirosoma sp. KCTC 42546]|uniref:hypothetical protein n=1 Tax=Spirosoma sp. KCTC 42546 TaxID=2520506 RepID=UPI001159CFC1|nr:hypothetical protein [Spirosoma sp. KCTC 42546]QDK80882.1 hypothetical protein EXU85_20605 [Spirosoma sp. KCTC 42546]
MKIQHKQSDEIRELDRHSWETNPEYQSRRNFWKVLDEGDPVRVFWTEDNGEVRDLGLMDRDHAKNMIKINAKQCHYEELTPEENPAKKNESELIDKILEEGQNNYLSTDRSTPDDYEKAFQKARRLGLLQAASKNSFELSKEGERAYELGGVENWKKEKEDEKKRHSIHISGGNAVIGNNNSGNSQGRDFLNSQSPTFITSKHPSAIPENNPIKKSDHSIWDKIKYISGIAAALAALIGLLVAIAKAVGYL